jgi:hypothetical protein
VSKRLRVFLPEAELRRFQDLARARGVSLADWVRSCLRRVADEESLGDVDRKLDAIRTAVRHDFPAPDVDPMLAEIERGYLVDDAS